MKLVKPSFSIWEQEPGLQGIYKQIEKCGRVCYRSEDKITEDSAKPFVDRMLSLHHGSVLEHGTVYLTIPFDYIDISSKLDVPIVSDVVEKYKKNPYTKWWLRDDIFSRLAFITTNYRVLMQGDYKTWEEASKNNYNKNWLNDLEYLCEPTEFHEKRITVKFVCDRGMSHEFVRHRVFSFAQESTRYCNYSKDKFNNEITYILPPWIGETDVRNFYENSKGDNFLKYNKDSLGGSFIFLFNLEELEEAYIALVKEEGWKPQQARAVLPNACKTELVMTGFVSQWKDFFLLRSNKYGKGGAHPSADELATPLYEEFVKRGYINE